MENEEVCGVCFSRSLALQNGALVCMVCGTQSQNFAEEAMDLDEQEAGGTNRLRRVRIAKGSKKLDDTQQSTIELIPKQYCLCLQEALFEMCQFLQLQHSLDDSIFAVSKRIWLPVVARSRVLEPGAVSIRQRGQRGAKNADEDEEEEGASFHINNHKIAIWKLLAPQSVLLVLHLATVYLKTAITPMDLIGQSVSGELPFYKAISNASMRLDPERKQRLWKYFSPIGMPGPQLLSHRAAECARDLTLKLPGLNAEAILQRYCAELELPLATCAGAVGLLEVYQAAGFRPKLELDVLNYYPYSQLMALLVFAARELHQWRAAGEWQGFDWLLWGRRIVRKASLRHPPGLRVDSQSVPDAGAAYEIITDKLYSAANIPEGLDGFQRALGKLALGKPPTQLDPITITPAGAAETNPALKCETDFSLLLTAASAVGGFKPDVLRRHVAHINPEMLKVERVAAKVGMTDPAARLSVGLNRLREEKLIKRGLATSV